MKTAFPTVKLGTLTTKIGSGVTPRGGEAAYKPSGIPFIRSQNVRENKLDLTDVAFIDDMEHAKMKGSAVRPNDVLLNITGASIGRSCVAPPTLRDANVSQHVCIIRLKDGTNPHFVSTYLNSWYGQKQIESFQGGGSREGLNYQQIGSLDIPHLGLQEQEGLAALLSQWEKISHTTDRLIAAKARRLSKLVQHFFTGNPSSNWPRIPLGDAAAIKKGQQLSILNMIEGGAYYVLNGGTAPSGYTDAWNTPENTITISEGGNSCGYVSFNTEKFWCGGHCYAVTPTDEAVDKSFLFQYLKVREPRIMRLRVGSGLPNIQKKALGKFPVLLPPLEEQKRIGTILANARREIELLEKQAAGYRRQKRGLMQKLLAGEWRVKA